MKDRHMPKREPKNRIVSLRLTEAEYAEMTAAAGREGRTVTDYIRAKTLELDRTFFRWGGGTASRTVVAEPAMMVWHDGTTGQTWPASTALTAA